MDIDDIYSAFDTNRKYRGFDYVDTATDELTEYIDKLQLGVNTNEKLWDLINFLCGCYERQGFSYGFANGIELKGESSHIMRMTEERG